MAPRRFVSRALPLAFLALLLPAVSLAAWPHDPAAGVPICSQTSTQSNPVAVSDGEGGAIIVWEDQRPGTTYDVYAQRIDSQGNPLWTTNGVLVNGSSNDQTTPRAVSDGAHGVIVCWVDTRFGGQDIYAQRLNASGTRLWAVNGVAVGAASGNQTSPCMAPDGSGGALIAWQDGRSGNWDIYAQCLDRLGTALWRSNGAMVCSLATSAQLGPHIIDDRMGGAFIAWTDQRPGTYYDVYAQRILSNGTASWTANGRVVCDAAYDQGATQILSDGDLGSYVVWNDSRDGATDIYAQHLFQAGNADWAANGIAVCNAANTQSYPYAVANGENGIFIAWSDYRSGTNYDIYAQYVSAGGIAQWTSNGRSLCTAVSDQYPSDIALDGVGDAIVVWSDFRIDGMNQEVYAQRVSESGSSQWASGGVKVGSGSGDQSYAVLVPDGSGGAIVAYQDDRLDFSGDISAQYVERFGHLGSPAPDITRVADVPNDQGGHVQVEWTACYLDTFPTFEIEQYTIWRQVPEPVATSRAERNLLAKGGTLHAPDGRTLRAMPLGSQALYWEQVGTQAARGLQGYSFVTATTSDSLPGSNPYTSFMVMAEEYGGIPFWMSAADSGYSVDDLAPPTPAPFTGTYASGTSYLQWGQSPASDFAEFRLHRGHEPGFVPAPENLVVAQTSAGYVDAIGSPYFYKLCAMDIHGNASGYAFLQPGGTTDVPGPDLPRELALSSPAPNPLRGSSTTLRLALPRDAQVSLAVFDQQGRRLRTLIEGAQPAGEHAIVWDGRDDGGRAVASGIYFMKCAVEGRVFTRRVAALR